MPETSTQTSPEVPSQTFTPFSRVELARKAAGDIPDGWYVNLGVGIPLLVSEHVPQGRHVTFQAENGLLGFGPKAAPGEEDWWVSNAGGVKVTINPAARSPVNLRALLTGSAYRNVVAEGRRAR